MTHSLSDKTIEEIKRDVFSQIPEKFTPEATSIWSSDCMRIAYNLGEIKGAAVMAIKVRGWLEDNVGLLLLCAESELSHRYLESLEKEFIQSFIDAVCPQEDNQ